MDLKKYEQELSKWEDEDKNLFSGMDKSLNRAEKFENLLIDTPEITDDLDKRFEKQTSLNGTDFSILLIAIGLQIVRQYFITEFSPRLKDKEAAEDTFFHWDEHSNRHHRLYCPSLEEIILNPVPFDANIGANGALSGGGKLGHRGKTLGHDPLLGLFFGTANIATSTLTTTDYDSFHIYTNQNKTDFFYSKAKTSLVIKKTLEKFFSPNMEDKKIIAVSFIKEIIHLRSDMDSINGLPLPTITSLDPKLASALAENGFDLSNTVTSSKQAILASAINTLISMFHLLYMPNGLSELDQKTYMAKTQKILMYSNAVACGTNIFIVGITKDLRKFDLGGLVVAIFQVIKSRKFIRQVKEEFVFGSYKKMVREI